MTKKVHVDEMAKQAAQVFGGMAASNAIGKALEVAARHGYKGIMITFIPEDEP